MHKLLSIFDSKQHYKLFHKMLLFEDVVLSILKTIQSSSVLCIIVQLGSAEKLQRSYLCITPEFIRGMK